MDSKEIKIINRCNEINCRLDKSITNIKSKDKLHLICNIDEHKWSPTYDKFVNSKTGCPMCNGQVSPTQEEAEYNVANVCKLKNYEYELFKYIGGRKTRIYLKCNNDGYEWNMNYFNLVNNVSGCSKCGGTLKITQKEAETEISKHTDLELVESFIYKNYETVLTVKCKKCGYIWKITYHNLLLNKSCPICRISKLEKEVSILLKEQNIKYEPQYKPDFLKTKYQQSLDFFLPDYNIAIECQGLQHFKPVDFAGLGEDWAYESYSKIIERDERKYYLCNQNNVTIYYYSKHSIDNYFEKIYTDFSEIIKDILNKKI